MSLNDESRHDRRDLDEAIDRVVRDMTRVEAHDDAVARVMARVRGARTSRARGSGFRLWSPRANWSFAATAALLMVVLIAGHSVRKRVLAPDVLVLASRPMPAVGLQPPVVSSVSVPMSLARASAAIARVPVSESPDRTMRATSIIEAASVAATNADTADEFHSDLSPREGDLATIAIAPAPLAESPALTTEPLGMHELKVDAIDPSPITVPSPVGPQR